MCSSEPPVENLSLGQLRNESGRVLREVSEGHSFILTNSGTPVGRIVPLDAPEPSLPITRPARRTGGWKALGLKRKNSERDLPSILDDLRGDRL
ncbi:type II toxin-antitoxin system Phd/YefM family antitoxin [Kocuria gwangalliensis]|uniref:type II toxin-antitoxin system Phd/YefM family antitoxin n=1 Tax=Kocuria gwangalliensis TaxID=501592 RepID=UPI0031EF9B75